ncbi:MAG: GAF domain-containing protein [Myxococcales bacterium]|jgi:hypothetical protein
MAKYEVFIPAALASEFNVTLKVEADNWLAALKSGLLKLGEAGTQVVNIMVDIMDDNSIHVTDSGSGRVFRIKELTDSPAPAPAPTAAPLAQVAPAQEPAPIPLATPAPIPPAAAASAPQPAGQQAWGPQASPAAVSAAADADVAVTQRELPVLDFPEPAPKPLAPPASARPVAAPAAQVMPVAFRQAQPAAPAPAAMPAIAQTPAALAPPKTGRVPAPAAPVPERRPEAPKPVRHLPTTKVEQVAAPSVPVQGPIGRTRTQLQLEEIFSDLFERTQDLFGMGTEQALNYLLDLAMEKIPSDAGSVFVSGLGAFDLDLFAARGPKARELEKMRLKVPMGVGIVGFCAQENVGLAISDTERDPRFYREVSEKIGYAAKSILCAPMVSGGRTFGCLEIINKKGCSQFSDAELAILGYVAHQGAKFLEQTQ